MKERGQDIDYYEISELCKNLRKIKDIIEAERLKSVIVCACGENFIKEDIKRAVGNYGIFTEAIEYIETIENKELHSCYNNSERLILELMKSLIRLKGEDFSLYNLKPVFKLKNKLTRRELFSSLIVKYELIPFIDSKKCLGREGCRICYYICDRRAIKQNGGAAEIEIDKCNSCGKCLWECPSKAIILPKLNPDKTERLMYLYSTNEFLLKPKVIIFINKSDNYKIKCINEHNYFVIELSDLKVINFYLLLKCFYAGIDGVIIYAENPIERRLVRLINFTKNLMDYFKLNSQRLEIANNVKEIDDAINKIKKLEEIRKFNNSNECDDFKSLIKVFKDGEDFKNNLNIISEFFSKIMIKEESCFFCEACVKVCPSFALNIENRDGMKRIIFKYSNCIGCVECIKICPLKLIKLQKVFDLEEYLKDEEVIVSSKEIYCKGCGKPYITEKAFLKIMEELKENKGIEKYLRYCPDCRIRCIEPMNKSQSNSKKIRNHNEGS